MYVCVCVSFTGSQAIHQTKFSHHTHTHTHKQNQRTDSSMKASSSRCRRSFCLWLYHAASLLAATKTAKKMFAPLPTAFWGKVFNLLHMHAKRAVGEGKKGVEVSSSECASCKLLLRALCMRRSYVEVSAAPTCRHAALSYVLTRNLSLSRSPHSPPASLTLLGLSDSVKNELQAWDLQVVRAGKHKQGSVHVYMCVCVWVCVLVCLCVYLRCRNMTFNLHKLCAFVSPPHAKHAKKFNSKKSAYPFPFPPPPTLSHSFIASSLTFRSTAWLMSIKEERSFMESKSKLSTLSH